MEMRTHRFSDVGIWHPIVEGQAARFEALAACGSLHWIMAFFEWYDIQRCMTEMAVHKGGTLVSVCE